MTASTTALVDLRRSPLAAVRAVDFRAEQRDFWADERALWDRLRASWAGLDDAAWALPGAAPSDAGGTDWSLQDHVGHVVDWLEMAADYVARVLDGGAWPSDDDYGGGDFDRYNEGRRERWAALAPAELRARAEAARDALLPVAGRLPLTTIRDDDGWGWVYNVLHGHVVNHLTVVEPWADRLRTRQAQGDPFTRDPRPAGDGSPQAVDAFWAAEASVAGHFDELVRAVPLAQWDQPGATAEWTLKDHVAHLARWMEECADAVDEHAASGVWPQGPAEGIDAWNAREVALARTMPPGEALRRFDAGRARLVAAARTMPPRELASPEAGEWVYECLHGHVRAHLAMVGPWCARVGWPADSERGVGH